jgi:hypothetical protein
MDKEEFLESFCRHEEEKHSSAERVSGGLVRYERRRNVEFKSGARAVRVDLLEKCYHAKGVTCTLCEVVPSFAEIDVGELISGAKEKAQIFMRCEGVEQCTVNIVIPPSPGMIMELGEHISEMLRLGNFAVTVYDAKSGRMGMFLIEEDFLSELREDPDYKGMSDAEIFTNFMMNYAELL